MTAFKELPILDLSLAHDPKTKPQFLEALKHALFSVGFLYLINHGIEKQAETMLDLAPKAFDVPTDAQKKSIAMTKSPHFVGYTALGAEYTNKNADLREQYDFGACKTVHPLYKEGTDEQWRRLQGPSAFLPDDVIPGFEDTITNYIKGMSAVCEELIQLVAECLNLPKDTLLAFQGEMHRLKVVKYPAPKADSPVTTATLHNGSSFQGVGPHKDSSNLFTFVLQDKVGGLEVLNSDGVWIPAHPIPGSFVVNIGQGFEALTGGRCSATTHQVVSPPVGVTRYSIPYFHAVRLDLTREMIQNQLSFIQGRIPEPTDHAKRSVDVPSEFIQPQYKCVCCIFSFMLLSRTNKPSLEKPTCVTEWSVIRT